MTPCEVDGCEKQGRSRVLAAGGVRMCSMHRMRFLKTGTTADPPRTPVMECSVEGCSRLRRGRLELCHGHRQRLAAGRPLVPITRTKGRPEPERFWEKIQPGPDGCWVWQGASDKAGYGWFKSPTTYVAHRWAYIFLVGPIPDGLHLDHLCRRPSCVNPYHLDPVPGAVNTRRAAEAQTHCKHGHLFDEESTAYNPGGYRYCRICKRMRERPKEAAHA